MKSNKEILTKIEFMIKSREIGIPTLKVKENIESVKNEVELLKELKKWCNER